MKSVNKIVVALILIFLVKRMFFDDSISLGIIDKYYGVVFAILLAILIVTEVYTRVKYKKNQK